MPDYNFWNERWINNQIGFHQPKPHSSLVEFISLMKPYKKVLVPLCGKSLDMLYLRDHDHDVIGVEFSELAILDFIKENNLEMKKRKTSDFVIYECAGLKIYQGDFFKLTDDDLRGVTACYDRASMVAFNSNERILYAKKLIDCASDLTFILAPIFNCGNVPGGPPFSVVESEVKDLYGSDFELKILKEKEFPLREVLKERGATFEKEITWQMNRKH